MRVVIDTNIVIAAALRDRDPEAVLRFVVSRRDVEWVTTRAIVTEYREVLRRPKFELDAALLDEWDALLLEAVVGIEDPPEVHWPNDPGDAMLVACALACEADYLVTGDKGLLHAGTLGRTRIITLSEFKKTVCDIAQ